MKTALEHYGLASEQDRAMVRSLQKWIDTLPVTNPEKKGDDELWSCHVVVRAAKLRFPSLLERWSVVDGFWKNHYQHSWLSRPGLVLDVYPVASFGGPVLFDADAYAVLYTPNNKFYTERGVERGFDFYAQRLFNMTRTLA